MRIIQTTMIFALCLALFSGASWARGTTVSVGETVPLGGTTTTTTTTTNTTTTTTEDEGPSEPIPQVQITPADGGDAPSTEGSEWENLDIVDTGDTIGGSSEDTGGAAATGEASTGGTAGSTPQNQSGGSACAPALVLTGLALALFVSRK